MPLGTDYEQQNCPVARTLEIVGERWTLLIVRDLFYGVRRFGDFRKHIGVPSAVLTERLARLVEHGVVARVPGRGTREEYELTPKGETLWPIVQSLAAWGNDHYMTDQTRRVYSHARCGAALDDAGSCPVCHVTPVARDVVIQPRSVDVGPDPVTAALGRAPHAMLEPLAT